MATYTKLCGILPYLILLLPMTIYELAIECRDADICTGGFAVQCTISTTIQETKSSGAWQITMPSTMHNTMPYLFRSYITKNTIPNKIPTQTWQFRTTTTMTIDHCKSTSESSLPFGVPCKAI